MEIQEIISDLKQIAAECEKVTSGNVSHRIANIEHGIINIADNLENYCPLGWHPASELPQLDENESSELIYALGKVFSKGFGEYIDKVPCRVRVIHGKWAPEDIEVEWWCYQPEEK